MTTGLNPQAVLETRNTRQMNEVDWFMNSTSQLRQRTAREGAWVSQPSRETVERLIEWFQIENSEIRQ